MNNFEWMKTLDYGGMSKFMSDGFNFSDVICKTCHFHEINEHGTVKCTAEFLCVKEYAAALAEEWLRREYVAAPTVEPKEPCDAPVVSVDDTVMSVDEAMKLADELVRDFNLLCYKTASDKLNYVRAVKALVMANKTLELERGLENLKRNIADK